MKLSKTLFTAAVSLALTGVAFAEDPPADPPAGGDGSGAPMPPPDGTPPAAAATGGEYTAETWPLDYVNRPQNIYKGGIEISPALDIAYSKTVDAMGNETSSTVSSLGVAGRYGVTDKIEVLGAYNGIILTGVEGIEAGDRVKGSLTVGGGMILAKGKLDAEVKAALNYDLALETAAVLAGVDVRYHLSPKMWVGTPVNRPGLVAFVKGLDLGVATVSPIFFNIPVAFAFQATPELAVQVNTDLLRLNLNEDAKGGPDGKAVTFLFQDEHGGLPLDFDFIYALNHKMDVQANLDLGDVLNAGDAFALTAGVNIRL